MANIDKELNQIKNAVYGREVRGSIHDGINKVNRESEGSRQIANNTEQRQDAVEQQFNTLLGEWSDDRPIDNAETIAARTNTKESKTYENLGKRLDEEYGKVTSQLADIENVRNWELQSKAREKKGISVFISDDGFIAEWDVFKDRFADEGVPFCIAVGSGTTGQPNYLTKEQLLTLQNDYGWEILAHSVNQPKDPLIIDIPDEQAEAEFRDSIKQLREWGLDVQSMTYVGGNYGVRERGYARKYYRAARQSDAGYYGGINYSPLNTYELKTFWIDPTAYYMKSLLNDGYSMSQAAAMTVDRAKQLIDEASENNGLVIFSTHTNEIKDNQIVIDAFMEVVQYAKTKTNVTTLREALNKMGNLIEIGDFSEQGLRAVGDNHFVVGVDGLASGTLSVAKENRFNGQTPFTYFPDGVTVVPITENNTAGLPFDGAGTLINYKPYPHEPGSNRVLYGWQEFVAYDNQLPKFRRDATGNSTYNEWYSDSTVNSAKFNNYDVATPYVDFPIGITISRITSDNPNLNQAPGGRQGTLITVKQDTLTNLSRYSFQEYHLWGVDLVYKRRVVGENEFGDWFLINGVTLADSNNYDTTTRPDGFSPGLTYSVILGSNPNVDDAPEKSNGTLITNRPLTSGFFPYTTQEYTPFGSNNKYHRNALNSNEWGRWKKTEAQII